jgi:hypothetical protein
MDMSTTIAPKSDQLNADDLISGPRTITVTRVTANPGGNGADQPVNVYFEGDGNKPFRPCKSMRRVMVTIWGKDAAQYVGRSMTIYRDPEVTWGGMKVGGIRISHMSHLDKPEVMALTATQKQRKPYRVDPLKAEPAQGNAPSPDAALITAKDHANKGKDAFLHWYNSDEGKAVRDLIKPSMRELQSICAKADENADPFDNPEGDNTQSLTPEDEDRIRREIEEENRKQAEGV